MSSKIRTLNQFLTVMEDIAVRHHQINTYTQGKNWEVGASESIIYPLLNVEPIGAAMLKSASGGYAVFEASMKLRITDMVNKDETNEQDVDSDTLEMLKDCVIELASNPYFIKSDFQIMGDLEFTTLDEVSDDETNGWEVEILLRTPQTNNWCGLPIAEVDGFSFPSITCSAATVIDVQYITNIINSDGNIDITHTGQTYEINSTAIDANELGILTNGILISGNTTDITNLDSNKYDKSGGTISGTVHLQENIYFDNNFSFITSASTVYDLSTGNIFIKSLTGSTELDYINPEVGAYIFEFNNQKISSVLTFATGRFKSPDGITPILTATAGARDSISAYYNGNTMILFTANNIIDLI